MQSFCQTFSYKKEISSSRQRTWTTLLQTCIYSQVLYNKLVSFVFIYEMCGKHFATFCVQSECLHIYRLISFVATKISCHELVGSTLIVYSSTLLKFDSLAESYQITWFTALNCDLLYSSIFTHQIHQIGQHLMH